MLFAYREKHPVDVHILGEEEANVQQGGAPQAEAPQPQASESNPPNKLLAAGYEDIVKEGMPQPNKNNVRTVYPCGNCRHVSQSVREGREHRREHINGLLQDEVRVSE